MKQEEERLGKEIDELMQQAEVADAEEDEAFGAGHNGYNLPGGLHFQIGLAQEIVQPRQDFNAVVLAAAPGQLREHVTIPDEGNAGGIG